MTQSSRPQAENRNNGFVDSGPYSGDEWRFRMRAAHTGDLNTTAARSRIRGVVPTYDNMLVTTVVGTTVTVGTGAGLVSGSYLFNDTEVDFDLDTVANRPALNSRIDILCMVENNTNLPATNGAAANGWVFPTVLTDYDGAAIPAYSARLVIVKGAEAAVPAAPVLDILNTLFMVPVYEYLVSPVPAISDEVDRREFADVEIIVGAHTDADDETHDALILGAVVNNGFGAAGLGAGVKFRLEDDAGLLADAGQLAVRSSNPTTTAEQTRMELRLRAGGADNLSAVINAPTAASVDGDARGEGAVDLQQERNAATQVASGAHSFLAGYRNTASEPGSAATGRRNQAAAYDSEAGGRDAITRLTGQFARSSGGFSDAVGTTQYSDYHLSLEGDHVGTSWENLQTMGGAAFDGVPVPDRTAMTFDCLLAGVGAISGNIIFGFRIEGVIATISNTTALRSSVVTVLYNVDDPNFEAQVVADNVNKALLIQVRRAVASGGTPVRWSAVVRAAEVKH